MYRRSTARVHKVSKDLSQITIKLPLSWKNKNYVGTIFGGSMFAAVDPIPMVQLINLLDDDYVVWDKSAVIKFKRPAKETLYANFVFEKTEVETIKARVEKEREIEIVKSTLLTNRDGDKEFCLIEKTLYIANKDFYKQKRRTKSKSKQKTT